MGPAKVTIDYKGKIWGFFRNDMKKKAHRECHQDRGQSERMHINALSSLNSTWYIVSITRQKNLTRDRDQRVSFSVILSCGFLNDNVKVLKNIYRNFC